MHKILIVEDDPDTAEVVEISLHAAGFEVVAANSMSDAFRNIAEWNFGAAVLDLSVITDKAQLAMLASERDLPLVVCSAASDLPERIKVFSPALTYALAKPFDISVLIEILHRACGSRRTQ